MKSATTLLLEAACIGAALGAAMYVACSNRGAWPVPLGVIPDGAPSAAAAAFVLAGLFHLALEAAGVNAWYARTYFSG
jgi:hypothetical protein